MQTKKHKILVPIDLDQNAALMLQYVQAIARKHNLHIVLAYLYPPYTQLVDEYYATIDLHSQQLTQAQEEVAAFLNEYDITPDFDIEYFASTSYTVLLDYIEEHAIKLVCISVDSISDAFERIVSNDQLKFIEKVNVPVLVIPHNYDGVLHEEFVFFTNFRSDDLAALLSIQQRFIEVTRLHILHITHDFSHNKESQLEELVAGIDQLKLFKQISTGWVSSNSVLHFMKNYIDTHPNTLPIVHMTSTNNWFKRLMYKSITKQLLVKPRYPILIV